MRTSATQNTSRATLAPATGPPSVDECQQQLTFGADGTASPVKCANGDVNVVAWRYYARVAGHGLPFTFEGLLIASVLYSMPVAVQPFAAEFASVDRRMLEASWSLGVSRLETFRRVVIPLSVRGLVTGVVLSFAHTLGEFGVVLMVGGNLPGVTRTVSISIYDAVQSLDYAAASRTSLLLLIVSFVILASTYSLQRSVWLKPRH